MSVRDWALLTVLSVLWSGTFFFGAIAVAELPTLTIVAARVGLSTVAIGAYVWWSGYAFPLDARTLRGYFGMGLLNIVIPLALIVWGQAYMTSGLAAILTATMPAFTVVIAHLQTRDERMTGGKLAGVVAGVAGVAVLIGVEATQDFGVHVVAELAMLAASLSYAFGGTYGRHFNHLHPATLATGQLGASTVLLVPAALIFEHPWLLPMPSTAVVASILSLALLSTAAAWLIYFRILATSGATSASLVSLLVPISALLLGMAFLGEQLTPNNFAGMALILFGLVLIDGRAWRVVLPVAGSARE